MGEAVAALVAPDAPVHLCHPFGEVPGGAGFAEAALAPLWAAMPDAERRVDVSIRGTDGHGQEWHGEAGHYAGTFAGPFLGIPPTGRMAFLRFHEFYRMEGARAVEVQAVWDLPDLMMQARVWPMGPALGRTGLVPGPMTQDGRAQSGDGAEAKVVVLDMLDHLHLSPQGEAAMRLDAFWHPRCAWYGPGGIGTARGIAGFRAHHQIPFLDALPDRRGLVEQGHFFGEGDYAAFTAWPGMEMTVTGGGWLGIAPAGQRITMRSLDFWRVEGRLIRENWVLVDLLHVWDQLGVDVLGRMRQLL
ncbi:ester cyclase [Jannaschia sp. W003]|uniref:ester cyclase n=1 Tax=Jannaschia sp. W003 TaxID=2867012 RepID=UPI0021A28D69|nr:ester cyclase [Jannaschia sp. W003]UWQ23064.1 ester cyclase [Jannaschia sp. W003]